MSSTEGQAEEVQVVSEWNDLTVQQLKEELVGRGLETTGRKADLVARLEASDKELIEKMERDAVAGNGDGSAEGAEGEDSEFVVWNDEHENEKALEEAGGDGADDMDDAKDDEEQDDEDDGGKRKRKDTGKESASKKVESEVAEGAEFGAEISRDKDLLVLTWHRHKINVPFRDEVVREMRHFIKKQNIIMYPIEMADIYSDIFHKHIAIATNVSMELDETVPGAPAKGYLRLKFGSIAEAETAMDELKDYRKEEGREINMRPFSENDSEGEVLSHVKKEDAAKKDPLVHRLLFVGNLPSEVTEAALKDHFVGVLRVYLPRKDDSADHNGYAFLEYRTEAETQEMLTRFQNTEVYGQTVLVIKSLTTKKETFGLLRDSLRKYWLEQLANLETTKAKSANKTAREIAEIDAKLLRLKRRIDKDNRIRESICLPVPEAEKFGTTEADSETEKTTDDKEKSAGSKKDSKSAEKRSPAPQRRRYSPTPRRGGYRGGFNSGNNYRGGGGYVPRGHANTLVNQLQQLVGVLAHKVPDHAPRSDYGHGGASSYGGSRSSYASNYTDSRDSSFRGSSYRGAYRGTGGSRYAGAKRPHEEEYGERKRRYEEPAEYGRYGDRDRGGYGVGSYGSSSRRGGGYY